MTVNISVIPPPNPRGRRLHRKRRKERALQCDTTAKPAASPLGGSVIARFLRGARRSGLGRITCLRCSRGESRMWCGHAGMRVGGRGDGLGGRCVGGEHKTRSAAWGAVEILCSGACRRPRGGADAAGEWRGLHRAEMIRRRHDGRAWGGGRALLSYGETGEYHTACIGCVASLASSCVGRW